MTDLLLNCRWTLAEHRMLKLAYTKRHPNGAENFLSAIHQAFPFVPSRRRLMAFLDSQPGLLLGMRWKRLPDIYWARRLKPTGMQPALSQCQDFQLPDLPSVGSLSDQLFRFSPTVVEWLISSRPEHYMVNTIAKRGGNRVKLRIIEQPKRLLKAAQRDILREILRWVPVHRAAHGFVRGRSVVSFTREHIGQPAILRMDIENFFPTIRAARVSAVFRSLGYPLPVAATLTDLCTTSSRLEGLPALASLARDQQLELSALHSCRHLPQGAPTSPALANLIAYRLDARLSGLARKAGLQYTRYADDLLFSGDRLWQRHAASFAIQIAAIVMDEGFKINHRKTRLMPRGTRQVATGVVLNQCANVNRREFDNLKATLINCVRTGPNSQNREQHSNFEAYLLGRISWVKQLNPARGEKLMEVFRRIQW